MEAIFCIFSKYFLESVTIVNFWLPYWGGGGWGEFCLTSKTVPFVCGQLLYRAFSFDVTGAILVYQAILPGIKIYFHSKIVFCFSNQYGHWSRE